LLTSTEKKCHVSSQNTDVYVRYWHLADNPTAPAFVLGKTGHAE